MVAGQDGAAGAWHVLQTVNARPPAQSEYAADGELSQGVQRRHRDLLERLRDAALARVPRWEDSSWFRAEMGVEYRAEQRFYVIHARGQGEAPRVPQLDDAVQICPQRT